LRELLGGWLKNVGEIESSIAQPFPAGKVAAAGISNR
jgi:hypothetical protein